MSSSDKFRCFSAAFRLSAVFIPLFCRKIPLFGGVAEFGSDLNRINHLEGWDSACEGPEQAYFAVFPLRTAESDDRDACKN
jgi:hypothetical protein